MGVKVSIITPVHNGVRTIAEAIESVLHQTEPNWEHIIVDDGSTDGTAAIVQGFRDPRIRYHSQAKVGRSAARNQGLDLAQGEYLLFLDADDWLLPNALHDHTVFLTLHPEFGISVSDGYFCTDQGEKIVSLSQRRGLTASGNVLARIVLDAGLVGASHTALVRSQVVEAHNLRFDPDLEIGEDWLFWIEVARYTQFGFTDAVTCKYRWHEGNTTLSATDEFRKAQLWEGRRKVMVAPYFSSLPMATRQQFFYQVLVDLLARRPDEQETVMAAAPFLALPRRVRGQLLRLAANKYLLMGQHLDVAKKWLHTARTLTPLDLKGHLIVALWALDLRIAKLAIQAWQNNSRKDDPFAPLQIADDIQRQAARY